jgi:hypothetical protein
MTRTKDFYHYLLAYTIVEIRAADTPEERARIRGLADMVHNIPEALCLEWTPDRDERIYSQIKEKARVHNLEPMLERWERGALRRIQADREQAVS